MALGGLTWVGSYLFEARHGTGPAKAKERASRSGRKHRGVGCIRGLVRFSSESFSRRTKKTFLEGNQKKEPQLDTNILYIYIYIYIYKKEVALQTKVLPPEGRFLHQFLSGIWLQFTNFSCRIGCWIDSFVCAEPWCLAYHCEATAEHEGTWVWRNMMLQCRLGHLSYPKKTPDCLVYIRDYSTYLYGDYKPSIRISTSQPVL